METKTCCVCFEECDLSERLPLNCVQCSEWLCSQCFFKIVYTCNNGCHFKYGCPVCKNEINVSPGFMGRLIKRMDGCISVDIKNLEGKVIVKIIKRGTEDEAEWSKLRRI